MKCSNPNSSRLSGHLRHQRSASLKLNDDERFLEHDRYTRAKRALDQRRSRLLSFPKSGFGIPAEFIKSLKQQLTIVEVIESTGTPMRRTGRSYVGHCPFHDDRTPSLVAWPEEGCWRCFGCDSKGSDSIAWMQTYGGLSFREAVGALAALSGLSVPNRTSKRRGVTLNAKTVRRAS